MQKQLLHGVPYYAEKGILYTWDTPAIQIGTYEGESISYKPEITEFLAGHLTQWRSQQQSRVRTPTITASRRNNANKATTSEDVEDNE